MNLVPANPLPDRYIEPWQHGPAPADDNAKIFLIDILAAIHRNRKLALVVGGLVAFVVLGASFLLTPLYQSTATIMLDTRHEQVVNLQAVLSNLPSDTFVVDSEVQVLQSPALARRVVNKLRLDQDPEFNAVLRPQTVWSQWLGAAKSAIKAELIQLGMEPANDENSAARKEESVVQAFQKNLTVTRQGLTYVISLSFWSQDSAKAVRIVNAVAQTYIEQQKDIKSAATRQANVLIGRHVVELQHQVHEAEQAVADYKSQNGLLSAVGAPLTESEISALNTQMATARAQEAEQQGKLAAALDQLHVGGSGAVGQAASSETIRQLRGQQADLITQEADLSKRYGPMHPALIKVREQRAALDRAIDAEISRVISAQEAETAAAQQRVSSLSASIERGRSTLALNNTANVKLGELQRDADAVRGVYESFLTRLKQTSAQEDIQDADAEIVSLGTIPLKPAWPSRMLALAAALVLAVLASCFAIIWREFMDRGIRSPEQAENLTGLPVLATIPQIANVDPAAYVVRRPMSDFAESIRNLRTSLFLSRHGSPPKVVALMSALPHEGKTTTTLALGRQCAESGARVVIIDADLRLRALTAKLPRGVVRQGLVELVQGRALLDDCLYSDPLSSAKILPIAKADDAGKDVFFAHDLGRVFDLLRARFDIVLVDTAPLLPLAEPRIVASHADAVLLLTRWQKTPQRAMQDAARLIRTLDVPIAGLALTCVDTRLMESFGYAAPSYGQRAAKARYYLS